MAERKKRKKETTSERFYTQEGAMTKPGKTDTGRAHVLTAREIAELERKRKAAKKKGK